jgi:D-glycero-D-manno-heptose 1,7-bisphosphate phosphatase
MRRAVIFDRDGVLNEVVDRGPDFYIERRLVRHTSPWALHEVRKNPYMPEVVHALKARGFLILMATNQPDVGYGCLSEATFQAVHQEIIRGLPFDEIFACRHVRTDDCECHKPKPGMLLAATKKWDLDMSGTIFVGDNNVDIQAARAARCRGILLRRPYNDRVDADHYIDCVREIPALV